MVQYIHTPWRDHAELLNVRRQFYPVATGPAAASTGSSVAFSFTPSALTNEASTSNEQARRQDELEQQGAVARVSMWMQRGGCPHMVESTALLTAAILGDVFEARDRDNPSSSYAVRASYSAAFSRFVTGLLDSHQDKQRKLSMYSVAKTIGLPATFVELRHQATHEQLPSLLRLRAAAQKALEWIWDYYWKDLAGETGQGATSDDTPEACEKIFSLLLNNQGDASIKRQLRKWDQSTLLRVLAHLSEMSEDPKVIRQSAHWSLAILEGRFEISPSRQDGESEPTMRSDLEAVRLELRKCSGELNVEGRLGSGTTAPESAQSENHKKRWTKYEGHWEPRPIGTV